MIIKLELTEDQARLVANACEFYARIRMGQFGEIFRQCTGKIWAAFPESATLDMLKFRKHIYPDLTGVGHSYGIGQFDDADKTYDVYQAIRYVMDGKEPFSYNKLPICTKETDDEDTARR